MRNCWYIDVVERFGQSTVYNMYATLLPTNPLFLGFSRYQNVNKEIIITREYILQIPQKSLFLGDFFIGKVRLIIKKKMFCKNVQKHLMDRLYEFIKSRKTSINDSFQKLIGEDNDEYTGEYSCNKGRI